MISLKGLDGKLVIVQMTTDDLCDLHNALYYASKVKPGRFDLISLTLSNLYEMIHHGFLTDFGRFKNYEYVKMNKEFVGFEQEEEKK